MKPPRRGSRRLRSILALASTAAMAAALMAPAATADEHTEEPPGSRGIDRVCPAPLDEGVEPTTFPDTVGNTHEDAINCAADYGITRGYPDGTFRPGNNITRAEMATFITNLIEIALDEELPTPTEDQFPDLDTTTHRENINKLAAAGVVSGRTGGNYDPGANVTRGQMARFIANSIDYVDNEAVDDSEPPATDTVYFADAENSAFAADIMALAEVGVVAGDSEGNYRAGANVTRAQMASFVMRGADYAAFIGRFFPVALVETFEVDLSWINEVDDSGDAPVFFQGEEGATGQATVTLDEFNRTVEFTVDYTEVTGPFDAAPGFHIHEGEFDENGPVLILLATGAQLDDAATADAAGEEKILTRTLTVEDASISRVLDDPTGHYLNLHSNAFEAGAIRGQLPEGGQDLIPQPEQNN